MAEDTSISLLNTGTGTRKWKKKITFTSTFTSAPNVFLFLNGFSFSVN